MTSIGGGQGAVRKRIAYFDVISIFSCLCVLIVHFNATVAGYNGTFQYPQNSLIPNFYLDNRVYLGSIGVSMFFMLSGARLMYTWRGTRRFYISRLKNIYPMYWIAFAVATMADFLLYRGITSDSLFKLLISIAGLDGYLLQLGYLSTGFYKLGEWFLGCILMLYIIFPLLHLGVEKCPIVTMALALVLYALCAHQILETVFILRIPEMLLGMIYVRYKAENHAGKLTVASLCLLIIAYIFRDKVIPLTVCIALSLTLYNALTFISQQVFKHTDKGKTTLAKLSNLTYPIFLTHHWLIAHMAEGFNLQMMPRRYIWVLFMSYLALTLLLSSLLQKYGSLKARKRNGS